MNISTYAFFEYFNFLRHLANIIKVTEENKEEEKNGKLPTSHRYNLIPLLRSRPGGFKGS